MAESETGNPRSEGLTHLDADGHARMVDVGDKPIAVRRARAEAVVAMSREAEEKLRAGMLPKGSPLEVVRLAAIHAVKHTWSLIPLCHPLRLNGVSVDLRESGDRRWKVVVEVSAEERTGVEMEAMTGASVGALALYDMVKAVDRSAEIEHVRLLEKSGGKSGPYVRQSSPGERSS